MKPDLERKHYYEAPLHIRKNHLHIHLSKELRSAMKKPKRALLVRKGDKVKIMRGKFKGREGKVARVSVVKRKIYVEGIASRSARGREVLIALQPSNVMLIEPVRTKEREELFKKEIFEKKKEKEEKKGEIKKEVKDKREKEEKEVKKESAEKKESSTEEKSKKKRGE